MLITIQLLCQLSYAGTSKGIITESRPGLKCSLWPSLIYPLPFAHDCPSPGNHGQSCELVPPSAWHRWTVAAASPRLIKEHPRLALDGVCEPGLPALFEIHISHKPADQRIPAIIPVHSIIPVVNDPGIPFTGMIFKKSYSIHIVCAKQGRPQDQICHPLSKNGGLVIAPQRGPGPDAGFVWRTGRSKKSPSICERYSRSPADTSID